MKKRKKQSITLIEIMIVILLIGLIGGALAFNMRGSVDKGKVFKSDQNAARVYDILMMASAQGTFDLQNYNNMEEVKKALTESMMVKDAEKLVKDGWGQDLTITLVGSDDIKVTSAKAEKWHADHPGQ